MASKELTTSKGKRASTTGRRNPQADQSNWRKKLQASRIKFDDAQKDVYLKELARTGRKGQAAEAAGVSSQTVANHLDNDPDFSEAFDAALERYKALLTDEVRRRGVEGWTEPVFFKGVRVTEPILDEDGKQVTDEEGSPLLRYVGVQKFDSKLLELEIKRVDPSYRDKAGIDIDTGGGGVIVAPADMTPEEWIEKVSKVGEKMDRDNTLMDGSPRND